MSHRLCTLPHKWGKIVAHLPPPPYGNPHVLLREQHATFDRLVFYLTHGVSKCPSCIARPMGQGLNDNPPCLSHLRCRWGILLIGALTLVMMYIVSRCVYTYICVRCAITVTWNLGPLSPPKMSSSSTETGIRLS